MKSEDDHRDLCKPLPKHGALTCGERHCRPLSVTNGSYRSHFLIPPLTISSPSLKPTEARHERDSVWFGMSLGAINILNSCCELCWRGNVDLQTVLDCASAIRYISDYANKPETVSKSYHAALNDFALVFLKICLPNVFSQKGRRQ
jgi:hypothetical protein